MDPLSVLIRRYMFFIYTGVKFLFNGKSDEYFRFKASKGKLLSPPFIELFLCLLMFLYFIAIHKLVENHAAIVNGIKTLNEKLSTTV